MISKKVAGFAAIFLVFQFGCKSVNTPGQNNQKNQKAQASPAATRHTLGLRVDFKVSVDDHLRKEYVKVIGLNEEELSNKNVSAEISNGLSDFLNLWGIAARVSESAGSEEVLQADLTLSTVSWAKIVPAGVHAPICEGTASLRNARGEVVWKKNISNVWLGGILSGAHGLWGGVLQDLGVGLFDEGMTEGLLDGLRKDGVQFSPSESVIAWMRNPDTIGPRPRTSIHIGGRLKDPRFVEPLTPFLDSNKFKCGFPCTVLEYLGEVGTPETIAILLRLLKEFPGADYDYCRDVFLYWLVSSLAKNASRDSSITVALIAKYDELKSAQYRKSVKDALAKAGTREASAFLGKRRADPHP